jgi:hypothetical protein
MADPVEPSPKPVAELVRPVPGPWKQFAIGAGKFFFVVLVGAAAQFIDENRDAITQMILQVLPSFLQGYFGGTLGALIASAVVWLRTRAAVDQRQKVLDALVTQPPSNLEKYYKL